MKHPKAREGRPVRIRGRIVDFSLWPVRKGRGGWISNTRLFVAEPWALVRLVIETECKKPRRPAALAFLEQSHDYYSAAMTAHVAAARPVLLYYCFLNLAKALVLTRGSHDSLHEAKHGLAERIRPSQRELTGAFLEAHPTTTSTINVFDELLRVVRGIGLSGKAVYDLPVLLRQVVVGHRLFVSAQKKKGECFLAVARAQILDNGKSELWLRIGIVGGDLQRLGVGQKKFLERSRLAPGWRRVASTGKDDSGLLWFEQASPAKYAPGWIANAIPEAVGEIRPRIWQTVMSGAPHRGYYLYLCPADEAGFLLPQLLSAYAAFFYFGSITRYRPHQFDEILRSEYGPFTESFLQEQPPQILFLMASEFARRDVAKVALV